MLGQCPGDANLLVVPLELPISHSWDPFECMARSYLEQENKRDLFAVIKTTPGNSFGFEA